MSIIITQSARVDYRVEYDRAGLVDLIVSTSRDDDPADIGTLHAMSDDELTAWLVKHANGSDSRAQALYSRLTDDSEPDYDTFDPDDWTGKVRP